MRDGRLIWRGEPVCAAAEIRLRGAHNLENAMAAAAVTLARGLAAGAVRAALAEFAGVAAPARGGRARRRRALRRRLEGDERRLGGGRASRSFPGGVHAILGGRGKGEDYAPLAGRASPSAARAAYLIGEEAPRLRRGAGRRGVPLHDVRRRSSARWPRPAPPRAPGEVVLLSPACASYDQYRSFEERGDHFKALARRGIAREASGPTRRIRPDGQTQAAAARAPTAPHRDVLPAGRAAR